MACHHGHLDVVKLLAARARRRRRRRRALMRAAARARPRRRGRLARANARLLDAAALPRHDHGRRVCRALPRRGADGARARRRRAPVPAGRWRATRAGPRCRPPPRAPRGRAVVGAEPRALSVEGTRAPRARTMLVGRQLSARAARSGGAAVNNPEKSNKQISPSIATDHKRQRITKRRNPGARIAAARKAPTPQLARACWDQTRWPLTR